MRSPGNFVNVVKEVLRLRAGEVQETSGQELFRWQQQGRRH